MGLDSLDRSTGRQTRDTDVRAPRPKDGDRDVVRDGTGRFTELQIRSPFEEQVPVRPFQLPVDMDSLTCSEYTVALTNQSAPHSTCHLGL